MFVETKTEFDRAGTRLIAVDFGGHGPPIVFLHGLAGYAGEWTSTARWLQQTHRVLAFDARGHGESDRFPADVSRGAHVEDVIFLIEQMTESPVVLIGQSLGGSTALLVAAKRPDLVRGLIVAEAGPAEGVIDEKELTNLEKSLSRWPEYFDSNDAATEFFGGPSSPSEAWVGGLEERDGALWARFDISVMIETLRLAHSTESWSEWDRIQCPILIVRAENGITSADQVHAMVTRNPRATSMMISNASHDLHLDRPEEWRAALESFLSSLEKSIPSNSHDESHLPRLSTQKSSYVR